MEAIARIGVRSQVIRADTPTVARFDEAEFAVRPAPESRTRAGRIGAAGLVAVGVSVLVTMPFLPGSPGLRAAEPAAVAVALGLIAAVLPWRRWPESAALAVPAVTFVLLAALWRADPAPSDHYLALVIAPLACLALTRRPGVPLAAAPVAIAAYAVAAAGMARNAPTLAFAVVLAAGVVAAEGVARVRRAQRRGEASVEFFIEASHTLAQVTDEREAASALAIVASDLLHAPYSSVLLTRDDRTDELVECSHRRLPRPIGSVRVDLATQGRLLRVALETGRLLFVPDTRVLDSGALPDFGVTVRSVAALPLPGEGGVLGVVLVMWARMRHHFDGADRRAGELLGGEAGRVLSRLRDENRVALEPETDQLTQVANRRAFARALERLAPGDTVVLLDLDHFDTVNEQLGHGAGDEMLRRLAQTIRGVARQGDYVARYGGDEFAMILSGASEEGAIAALKRVREVWAGIQRTTTFSSGVAVRRSTESPAGALGRADHALYTAKQAGRNRDELSTMFATTLAEQLGI